MSRPQNLILSFFFSAMVCILSLFGLPVTSLIFSKDVLIPPWITCWIHVIIDNVSMVDKDECPCESPTGSKGCKNGGKWKRQVLLISQCIPPAFDPIETP